MTKAMQDGPIPEVGIVIYPGVQPAAVHGLTDLFAVADTFAADRPGDGRRLRVTHWRPERGDAAADPCIYDSLPGAPPRPGVLVVPPTMVDLPAPETGERLARWLAERHAAGVTLASVCSGAYVLAATGLLDGRTASTHHSFAGTLAGSFPGVRIDLDCRIIDHGDVVTAGGFMAWVDVGLMLVERYLGAAIRVDTTRFMFADPAKRGETWFAGFPPNLGHGDEAVRRAQDWIHIRDGSNLTLTELAAKARLSPRTFQRRFAAATGMTVADYCRQARLSRARELLEASNAPIKAIAASLGYREVPSFVRVFRKGTGETPAAYRRRFGAAPMPA
jgi:transcriptional regulator GlxA family with amidase domain